MKYYFFTFSIFCATVALAQTKPFKISGTLISEAYKTPLEAATIYLERAKDSSLVTYTISDKNGTFSLEGKTTDSSLNLYISYVGYQTHYQSIHLNQEAIYLSTINLKTDMNALEEVFITSRAPVRIKKDTLEFNASSFKTKKDATIEDLLKQLPGVEVDPKGRITINGKAVDEILVNGKPFFGNDPTITTRNLSKDIIENVQVTNTKTKAEAFAGDEGNKDKKTINLTIKKKNSNGVFGRVAAGAGTNRRYMFAGMLNLFDDDQRISMLAGGNNTNSPGFGFKSAHGDGEGIITSQNYGANYVDTFEKKLDISAHYFHSDSRSENERTSQRAYTLPNSKYVTNSDSNLYNETDNHSVDLGFNINVNSTLLINMSPSFKTTHTKIETSGNETSRDDENTLTNQSSASLFAETIDENFSNNLDVTKLFGNNGAYFKFHISNEYNTTETDDYLTSETAVFGANPETINRNQLTYGDLKKKGFYTNIAYRLPLKAKELFLDFKFSYRNDIYKNTKSTYGFDTDTQDFALFNADLSTDFEYTNKRSTPGLKVMYMKETWSISVESGYMFRTLNNIDFLRPHLSLTKSFEALELRSGAYYQFSPKSSMSFGYGLNNIPPQLSQLQPFQDISDPLNTITGNPNLEPTNIHSLSFDYNMFDFQKHTGFISRIEADFRNNQVVPKTTINENFVRHTTYANVEGGYDISTSGSYSKLMKIDSLKTLKYVVGLSMGIHKFINFNNDVQYVSNNNSLTPYASLTFTWKDVMTLMPNYRATFNRTKFDLDNFKDQQFIDHSIGLQLTTYIPKKFEWQHNISFNYNPNITPGFQKSAWFWNTSLVYTMLKDQGTFTFMIYDLLNQNTNAKRMATENYIQDLQSTVLKQYFMLSFSWRFNNF